jgi:hypothetical protein
MGKGVKLRGGILREGNEAIEDETHTGRGEGGI